MDTWNGQKEVTVRFPECQNWVGLVEDLEMFREPVVGDRVQVKLTSLSFVQDTVSRKDKASLGYVIGIIVIRSSKFINWYCIMCHMYLNTAVPRGG